MIVDWCANCEAIVQTTKNWTKFFRKHLNWRFDTNLTTTKFSQFQNYCDNESIFVIFTILKCAHFALQYKLFKWKSYVIVNCDAKCAIIERCWNVLKWSWHMSRLKTRIMYWLNLSALRNTNAELIRMLSDRSLALSEFTEYFIIGRFYGRCLSRR